MSIAVNQRYQGKSFDKTRNLASFIEDIEDMTIPLLMKEDTNNLSTYVKKIKAIPQTSKKSNWLSLARSG